MSEALGEVNPTFLYALDDKNNKSSRPATSRKTPPPSLPGSPSARGKTPRTLLNQEQDLDEKQVPLPGEADNPESSQAPPRSGRGASKRK
jgi:hypothetical protein